MCIYSALFMRFALAIRPKNDILFACHFCNEAVQLNQMRRNLEWRSSPDGQVHGVRACWQPWCFRVACSRQAVRTQARIPASYDSFLNPQCLARCAAQAAVAAAGTQVAVACSDIL